MPTGWYNCSNFGGGILPYSTWSPPNALLAYDGYSYFAMDFDTISGGLQSQDSIGQKLFCPLIINRLHRMSIYIYTIAEDNVIGSFGHGIIQFWGGDSICRTRQLLWQSPATTNEWAKYNAAFMPIEPWAYFTIKPLSIDGRDETIAIDAVSDITVESYTFLAIDTTQTVNSNCYMLNAKSDVNGVSYTWQSVPVLQFEDDSIQQVCISEDTWVYVDLVGACDVYRDSVLLKYREALTGINTNEDLFKATVYPNPASQFFAINYSSVVAIESIQLVNTMGQVVAVHKASGGYEKFEVQGLASCVYFLQFINEAGNIISTKKVLINR